MADRAGGFTGGADTSIYRVPETNMLDTMGKAIGLARQSTGLEQDQFNLQMGRLGALNAHLSSLIADPEVQAGGPGAMKKITEVGGRLVSMGIVPAKDLTVAISGINPTNPIAALRQAQLNTLSAQERMNAVYGTPMIINDGQTQRVMRQSPFMGAVVPQQGGTIQNQPGPSELLTRVPGPPDPRTGAPTTTTLGGAAMGEGALNPNGTINLGPSAAQAPNRLIQSTQPQGVPQRPANPLPVQQPQQPPAQARSPLPAPAQPQRGVQAPAPAAGPSTANIAWGSTVTGLPPGQAQASTVEQEAGANQGVALERAADSSPQRLGQLNNLEKSLGQFESGPQAERARRIKGTVNQVGSVIGVQPFDAKSLAAQESFVKESTMLAQQQFAALGGTGTDQQLGSAMKSNPSEMLSKEGNRNIIAMLKGNEAALNAKNAAWQQWKATNGPGSYSRFSEDFNRNFSPRAFQWAFLPPEERKKMYESMTPSERGELGKALKTAEERGWIRPDGQKTTLRAQ